nr:hypothetical protein [Tanacetum cinerariifolium]
MRSTTVHVVTKHVQSVSSSVNPVRRYGNLASGYEFYMLATHSELPNSTQWIVPKPLRKLRPPDPIVVQSHSGTVYPRPICQPFDISESACPEHNLLRGGNSASEVSSLRSTGDGIDSEAGNGSSGENSNGTDMGTGGGKCSDDGGGGSGGEGICGSRDDSKVSGDGGGMGDGTSVGAASSVSNAFVSSAERTGSITGTT